MYFVVVVVVVVVDDDDISIYDFVTLNTLNF